MNAFLNELSLTFLPPHEIDDIIDDFIYVCIALKEFNNHIVALEYFADFNLMTYQIRENEYLSEYLKNRDIELLRKIRSLVTTASDENFGFEEIKINGKSSKGAAKAYLKSGITISFRSHEQWTKENIKAIYHYIEGDNIKEKSIEIRNANNLTTLLSHKTWLNKTLTTINISIDEPIPFPKTTERLIGDYYEESKKKPERERIAIFKEIAEKITRLNQYKKEDKLTQKNNRIIYESLDKKIYLALDTQHGTFECCNSKGIHQKEIDFLGNPTKKADTSGQHNIKM